MAGDGDMEAVNLSLISSHGLSVTHSPLLLFVSRFLPLTSFLGAKRYGVSERRE